MKHSRHADRLVVRFLLCLFVISVSAAVPPALAQQPDAARVYTFVPGGDIELPRPKKEVRPNYTAAALRRRIQGTVFVEIIVMPTGKVSYAAVTKSLDKLYGLDEEALKAARKWQFTPGRKLGKPVSVLVTLELKFTIKSQELHTEVSR